MLLMILLVVLGILVFSFYGLLLWSLFEGNVSNPLFEVFGIDAPNLKAILIQFTNGIFGTICLILLIATLATALVLAALILMSGAWLKPAGAATAPPGARRRPSTVVSRGRGKWPAGRTTGPEP